MIVPIIRRRFFIAPSRLQRVDKYALLMNTVRDYSRLFV
jgi:hypothetical protein